MSKMVQPMIPTIKMDMIGKPRAWRLSEKVVRRSMTTSATTYGGTVNSWAYTVSMICPAKDGRKWLKGTDLGVAVPKAFDDGGQEARDGSEREIHA